MADPHSQLKDFQIVAQPPNGLQRDFRVTAILDGDRINGRAGFTAKPDPLCIDNKLEILNGQTMERALQFQKLVSSGGIEPR